MSEEHRRELVEALKPVDRAVLGGVDFDTKTIIESIKPDVIALGYDQEDLAELLEREGLSGRIVRLGKYGEISSSKIREMLNSKVDQNRGSPLSKPHAERAR